MVKNQNGSDYDELFIQLNSSSGQIWQQQFGGSEKEKIEQTRLLDCIIPDLPIDFEGNCDFLYNHERNMKKKLVSEQQVRYDGNQNIMFPILLYYVLLVQ